MEYWTDSSGKIELCISLDQAKKGYHSGACDLDISELMQDSKLSEQLSKLDPKIVADTLQEYGGWSYAELSNHSDNLERLLWIACGDVVDFTFSED